MLLQFEIGENDYIVAVDISCDKISIKEDDELIVDEHIVGLCIKTKKGKSTGFYGSPVRAQKTISGHKIVGFHGRSSSSFLVSLGVRVAYPPVP